MDGVCIRALLPQDIEALFGGFESQGWHKPRALFERYFARQQAGELFMFVAQTGGRAAGYAVLYPFASFGPFAGIPEIADFNVLQRFQRRGLGGMILDAAEQKAADLCDTVSLGVGLHSGYGAAQRMYVKRGYIPDGSGVWFNNAPLAQYADCVNNDDLVLYLSKKLVNALKME